MWFFEERFENWIAAQNARGVQRGLFDLCKLAFLEGLCGKQRPTRYFLPKPLPPNRNLGVGLLHVLDIELNGQKKTLSWGDKALYFAPIRTNFVVKNHCG